MTVYLPASRRSLPQVVALSVAKAVLITLAVLAGHVGSAVHRDFADFAEGRRTTRLPVDVDPARVLTTRDACSDALPAHTHAVCLFPVD